ncbi:MAG: hypothetical protein A3A33_03275 [Candidatus Yanofskybacteria bacterium RIFCSPLOWO2_01_FULL_49_25]|uniref:Peptidase M50 domain-containing protein n=1 Tax=Candidatus Yanofskybacteria bacterium RIFCSPLOWO2_01_FULL_49_25 TaxID=1802701 RepID=A0A1F8GTM4_9BACT|nr:MAG: hypothetical protein A3A33_03275 [Candidatus Yanofskybacteria bacterium RIFCSPLOWO2_01_FULL_49_25]
MVIIFEIIAFLFSVVLHEVSHGLAARSMGDETAHYAGRLTLNPLKHLDTFGSILLPLILYIASQGSFIFGYAKPVPYNPLNLRDQKYGPAKVALAGPLANIALAVLFGLLMQILPISLQLKPLTDLIQYIVWINLVLAVFNLVPLPPLDGHWILLTFLPASFDRFKQFYIRYGLFFFIIFLLFFSQLLLPLISFLFRVIIGA